MDLNVIPGFESDNVISAKVSQYIEQFQEYARITAEAIIEMGYIVYSAKQSLNQNEFTEFCQGIRYDSDSSSIRKLEQIGIKASLLRTHAAELPNTWTTIYQLTQLEDETFVQAIESGKVHCTMSGSDAKKLVDASGGGKKSTPKTITPNNFKTDPTPVDSEGYALKVVFMMTPSRTDAARLEELIQKLVDDQEFDCSVIRTPSLNTILNNVTES